MDHVNGREGREGLQATAVIQRQAASSSPGRRTLVEQTYGQAPSAAVQRQAEGVSSLPYLSLGRRGADASVQMAPARQAKADRAAGRPTGEAQVIGAARPATPPLPIPGPVQGAGNLSDNADNVHAAAAHGISGSSGSLPHLAAIQASFGAHDVSGVRAHTDSKAAEGARAMGAEAYATGSHVAFGTGSPSLHTAAHEAAHVVQQRGGVQLRGGVGQTGDAYEQHADAVAERVVRGESATDLLDNMGSPSEGLPARSATGTSTAIQRQDPGCTPGPPVPRGDLSALRTIAQGYIGDYFSAAQAGILTFESDANTGFNWADFWVVVGGNLIWATASFATGGTAFIISVGGIALSTIAAADAVNTGPDFRAAALMRVNDIVVHLNDQVVRVTGAVDADATTNSWDDSRTRTEILHRLFRADRPELVLNACGGLPNVNQPAISASVREQLLIRASQQSKPYPMIWERPYYSAYFEEVYNVEAIEYIDSGMGAYPNLLPQQDWAYSRTSAQLVGGPPTLNVNQAINECYDAYGTGSRIDPSQWPIQKRLTLTGSPPFGVTYVLDGQNRLSRIDAPQFAGFLETRGYNADSYLRNLLVMIQGHANGPIPLVSRLTLPQ